MSEEMNAGRLQAKGHLYLLLPILTLDLVDQPFLFSFLNLGPFMG